MAGQTIVRKASVAWNCGASVSGLETMPRPSTISDSSPARFGRGIDGERHRALPPMSTRAAGARYPTDPWDYLGPFGKRTERSPRRGFSRGSTQSGHGLCGLHVVAGTGFIGFACGLPRRWPRAAGGGAGAILRRASACVPELSPSSAECRAGPAPAVSGAATRVPGLPTISCSIRVLGPWTSQDDLSGKHERRRDGGVVFSNWEI